MIIRDTVDPVIEVDTFKHKKFTTDKDDIGPNATVAWNEHLFFEQKDTVSLRYFMCRPNNKQSPEKL